MPYLSRPCRLHAANQTAAVAASVRTELPEFSKTWLPTGASNIVTLSKAAESYQVCRPIKDINKAKRKLMKRETIEESGTTLCTIC